MESHLLWPVLKEAPDKSYEPDPSKLWPSSQPLNHTHKANRHHEARSHDFVSSKMLSVESELTPDLDNCPLHGTVMNWVACRSGLASLSMETSITTSH